MVEAGVSLKRPFLSIQWWSEGRVAVQWWSEVRKKKALIERRK